VASASDRFERSDCIQKPGLRAGLFVVPSRYRLQIAAMKKPGAAFAGRVKVGACGLISQR